MTLAEALARDVPERTRVKGNRYFLGGAVRGIEGSDTHVTATVRGTEWYQVHLTRSGDEFLASCGCPYFSDRNDFCKHIWAVILAADAEGFLIGNAPLTGDVYLESAYTGGDFDLDPRRSRPAPPPPTEPWSRFLAGVQQRTLQSSPGASSRYARGQLLYVIDRDLTTEGSAPAVQVQWRTRKKSGGWSKPQAAAVSASEIDALPEAADREIISLLLGASDSTAAYAYTTVAARASFRLTGPLVERVLPMMADSGRLYLGGAGQQQPKEPQDSPPGTLGLVWDNGPPWTFGLVVERRASDFRVSGTLARDAVSHPVTAPDLVLSPQFVVLSGAVARFDARRMLSWVLELRRAGGSASVPVEAASTLSQAFARSGVEPAALPDELRYTVIEAAPLRRIRVSRESRPHATREELTAHLEFDYAGTVLPAFPETAGYDPEGRRMVRRDPAAEREALQRLLRLGFHQPWYSEREGAQLSIPVDRFPAAVRTLVDEGWYVEAEGRLLRSAKALRLQVKSGIDWFELHGRVDFGDGRSASIAELLAALRRGDATIVLDDGTRGMVPEEWLQRYARIAAFGESDGGHVRYRVSQTALLDALLEAQPAVSVDETFARARQELTAFDGIRPLDPPSTFRGRLRDYQREALGWFEFLRRFGFGGCLADDMGLGKTVMVLALLDSRRKRRGGSSPRPSIAVVPRSLVFNWLEEAARFAPGLQIIDYTGEGRTLEGAGDGDLLLTTYGTLRRDAALLAELEFDYVILDEAQAIKNAATAAAKAARLLRGRHRLALSGTPIENHFGELWSLFQFLNPGFLGPAASFGRLVGSQTRGDRLDLALVSRALRPFILRRTKEQVAPELPPKVEQTIHCELEPAQRRFYEDLRTHYRQTLLAAVARNGMNRSKVQVLEALLRLRQAAIHTGLVDPRRREEASAKFELLVERLREVVDEGHKALVFSQFTSVLSLLQPHLGAAGITYEYLDGRTRDRAARVARFEQDRACPLFLISLKAGAVGLNLTAADYVFLLDPWWNPAVEAQAIDRTHRIGQSKHVFAYRLIARDTVEEKIAELQTSKRELADAIFAEDAGLIRTLRPEDLDWLLS